MEPLKKHGDPLEDEIAPDTVRGADVVSDNDPGSKGTEDRGGEEFVRSASQTPNPNQPSDDATMEPGGDLGHKRTNM
jgi:hypothetical protein